MVEVAASLAGEEGLEAITLVALASRLGVRTPSLYNHFTGLEGLRRELTLLTSASWSADSCALPSARRPTRGSALAKFYRAFLKERPKALAATVRYY